MSDKFTEIRMGWRLKERDVGDPRMELAIWTDDEGWVTIFSTDVNPDYMHGGARGAGWGIVVNRLAAALQEDT